MTRQWSRTAFFTPSILIRFSHLTSGFFEAHLQVWNGCLRTNSGSSAHAHLNSIEEYNKANEKKMKSRCVKEKIRLESRGINLHNNAPAEFPTRELAGVLHLAVALSEKKECIMRSD